jgi:hypothetical protein
MYIINLLLYQSLNYLTYTKFPYITLNIIFPDYFEDTNNLNIQLLINYILSILMILSDILLIIRLIEWVIMILNIK